MPVAAAMLGSPPMKRPLRGTITALAAGSFIALFDVFRTTVTRLMDGNTVSAQEVMHRALPLWLHIVITSPWCAWMAYRFPFRAGHAGRALAAHFAGALVFTAIQLGLLMGIHSLGPNFQGFPDAPRLLHSYVFFAAMLFSVYAAIVLVVLLTEARREAAEGELIAARLAQGLTTARLESLQAQMQPHFLFNTLNAIAVLARRGEGAAVDRAIADLGDLLRASFRDPARHEIPLGEELELLERYLGLQRIRFPGRLDVTLDVTDEARRARVPALVVQPMVENAIEHGLATARGGRVHVAARRDGDMLEIEVRDDGPGFGAADAASGGGAGVGLANTRERLSLLHGDRASITCGDAPGGGALVRIRLPWLEHVAPGPVA